MKHFLFILATLFNVACLAGTYTVKSVPNVQVENRKYYVSDPDNILSAAAKDSINSELAELRSATTAEAAVVIVENIDPADAETFATELFEHWGLGKSDKDSGLLILVVKDLHKVVIRTGKGMEGVLPDITCGRIIRNYITPRFKESDYDNGLLIAVKLVKGILTDEINAADIASDEKDNYEVDEDAAFKVYMCLIGILVVLMLAFFLGRLYTLRGRTDHDKYVAFNGWKPIMLILSVAGLFIPCVVSIPYLLALNHWRNHSRRCPNCKHEMKKLDEVTDNNYLTPAQDLEEQIGSVDYDVWLCSNCGETDVLPYVNSNSNAIECEQCHARTAVLQTDRILLMPTGTTKGKGVKEYHCRNCQHITRKYYDFDENSGSGAALAILGATAIMSSGRGGFGGGFGGGSIGGGFGGGHTGGGGASGSW